MVYGKIFHPEEKYAIDDVLVVKFNAPNSFTGEEVVEIHCHGGNAVASEIMKQLLTAGARIAEPGEFTKRAFLNGKIDLLQAEAVADVIHSKTTHELKASQMILQGHLSQQLYRLRERLKEMIIICELQLDFSEEDIELKELKDIKKGIDELIKLESDLLNTFEYGRILKEGIHAVIIGRPNVGKSSILNRLLKEERAIVSEHPGTTRDSIEEQLDIKGYLFKIADTAGIREDAGEIEQAGIARTKALLYKADLLLFVIDGSTGIIDEDREALIVAQQNRAAELIQLVNKIDLGVVKRENDWDHALKNTIEISAKTGEGFFELEQVFLKSAESLKSPSDDGVVLTKMRHYEAMKKSLDSLQRAKASIENNLSWEFVAYDLRNAANHIKEMTGELQTEELLQDIFSQFCIGK